MEISKERVNTLVKLITKAQEGTALPNKEREEFKLNEDPWGLNLHFYQKDMAPNKEPNIPESQTSYECTSFNGTFPSTIKEYIKSRQSGNSNSAILSPSPVQLSRFKEQLPLISSIFEKYGIPIEVANLCIVESGANPEVQNSPQGAIGPWQLMPHHAAKYNYTEEDLRDWRKSTEIAAKLLKNDYDHLGSWDLAVMAYNCGRGSVNDNTGVNGAISRANLDPKNMSWSQENIWKIWEKLPRETKDFYLRWLSLGQQ